MKLREFRINNGYMIQQMAEVLGISKSHYEKIESGRRKPSHDVMKRAIDEFDVFYDKSEILPLFF